MNELLTRFNLTLIAISLLTAVEAYSGMSYPLPVGRSRETKEFDPKLKQHCLRVLVSDRGWMKDWSFGQGYYDSRNMLRSRDGYYLPFLQITLDFRNDGSIAKAKLKRTQGWEDKNAPAIEWDAKDFAINYGWLSTREDGWELRAFSHRHISDYGRINFGLTIQRSITDRGWVGEMTAIHFVIFEQRSGEKERTFRSVDTEVRACQ